MDTAPSENAEEVQFDIPRNGHSLSNDDGVYKIILQPGTSKEKPSKGSRVTVHYTGRLQDGTVFDSSHNHGQKFSFNVGRSEVIKGWDLCVASMQKGEKCELHCAPKYGYGSRGSPPKIPPNAVLIFEIELFEWEGEDLTLSKDKGIIRDVLEDGEDYSMPNEGATVTISLEGKYQGGVFDKRDKLKYNIGEAEPELNLIPAIDVTLKQMKRGGVSRINVEPKYGFGAAGCAELNIPPDAVLEYTITLEEFEKAKESWEMTDQERIEQSELKKESGTNLLKEGKVERAVIQYKKILDYLEYHDAKEDGSPEDKEILQKSKDLKLKGLLNLALCYGKLKDHSEVIDKCNQALEIEANNEKGIYRKGEALFNQKDFNDAKSCFTKVVQLFPSNKAARSMIDKCCVELRKQHDSEKQKYKGMFDKFSRHDQEEEIRKKIEVQKEKQKMKSKKNNDDLVKGTDS